MDPKELAPDRKETWLRWLASASYVHRHVGWMPSYYWLGCKSSLYLPSQTDGISACMIACPDDLETAWIQVFAADTPPGVASAWERLWPAVHIDLLNLGVSTLWAMSTQDWFTGLLESNGFISHVQVIALSMTPQRIFEENSTLQRIRPMRNSDFDLLLSLDYEAFQAPWRMDSPAFHETLQRSALATVIHSSDGALIGYQMSIPTAQGVHLARLAVHPKYQGKGYGRALTVHLINYFHRRRAPVITLNTQSDNARSFRLYRGLGFRESGEVYPCFRYDLTRREDAVSQ